MQVARSFLFLLILSGSLESIRCWRIHSNINTCRFQGHSTNAIGQVSTKTKRFANKDVTMLFYQDETQMSNESSLKRDWKKRKATSFRIQDDHPSSTGASRKLGNSRRSVKTKSTFSNDRSWDDFDEAHLIYYIPNDLGIQATNVERRKKLLMIKKRKRKTKQLSLSPMNKNELLPTITVSLMFAYMGILTIVS